MLRALIIDDEPHAIATLKVLMERNAGSIRLVASTTDEREAIALIRDYKPDVVFLDISMPVMSGFELLEKLDYRDFTLVFTTAHREYAIKAIKNDAFDYLLKPIDANEFRNCIEKIASKKTPSPQEDHHHRPIELSVKDGIIFIRQCDIIRLEASRSYTVFYLDGGTKQVASRSLKEYETQLDESIFYRCHNSHIVNLQKVKKFVNHDGFFAQMEDGSLADISKKCKDIFLEKLKNI